MTGISHAAAPMQGVCVQVSSVFNNVSIKTTHTSVLQSQREVKRFVKREKREQQHREQIAAAEANAFQFPRSAAGGCCAACLCRLTLDNGWSQSRSGL